MKTLDSGTYQVVVNGDSGLMGFLTHAHFGRPLQKLLSQFLRTEFGTRGEIEKCKCTLKLKIMGIKPAVIGPIRENFQLFKRIPTKKTDIIS